MFVRVAIISASHYRSVDSSPLLNYTPHPHIQKAKFFFPNKGEYGVVLVFFKSVWKDRLKARYGKSNTNRIASGERVLWESIRSTSARLPSFYKMITKTDISIEMFQLPSDAVQAVSEQQMQNVSKSWTLCFCFKGTSRSETDQSCRPD